MQPELFALWMSLTAHPERCWCCVPGELHCVNPYGLAWSSACVGQVLC